MKGMGKYSMRNISRREFVGTTTSAAAVAAMASTLPAKLAKAYSFEASPYAILTGSGTAADLADPERMKKLVLHAVEAARTAGARYAEARVTRTVSQVFIKDGQQFGKDQEDLTIGVRVLVDGAWGFAASPYWDLDEAVILAKDAVNQAKINASVFPEEIDLGNYPVAQGTWSTPIRIDPFKVSIEEKMDFFASFDGLLPRHVRGRLYELGFGQSVSFFRQERTVANSEGSLFSQTLYNCGADPRLAVKADIPNETRKEQQIVYGKGMSMAPAGWELFLDANLREQIPEMIEEAESNLFRFIPQKPVEVGRYDMVIAAPVMASLISVTLSNATQLDRAMGFEANAGGTSYLGPDPMKYLGSALGSSLLTVHGDRSFDKGLATVKWDDEGVMPEPFPIIDKGKLVDYQTTREQAPWISEWYSSNGREAKSHGCSCAPYADNFPLQHAPNLIMHPGDDESSFSSMIDNTENGIALFGGRTGTDFQSLAGSISDTTMREIVNGKLGAYLVGGEVLFTSRELWKNLIGVGGSKDRVLTPRFSSKGQPAQGAVYSIEAYSGMVKEPTVVDQGRKG